MYRMRKREEKKSITTLEMTPCGKITKNLKLMYFKKKAYKINFRNDK